MISADDIVVYFSTHHLETMPEEKQTLTKSRTNAHLMLARDMMVSVDYFMRLCYGFNVNFTALRTGYPLEH